MKHLSLYEQKRYSLQAGPPKKDPKSKGVNPAAVQALLKKQCSDTKKKGICHCLYTYFLYTECQYIITEVFEYLSIFLFFFFKKFKRKNRKKHFWLRELS